MIRRIAVAAALLVGCGGGWNDADTKAATDAVRAEQALLRLCDGATDAGAGCTPSQVRAVERSTTCNIQSMLYRHGAAVPESITSACAPP